VAVITVSRQCGSGGREIARAVADILGATYVDRHLISEAARRLGVAEELVAVRDERVEGITEKLIDAVALAFTGTRSTGEGRQPGVAGGLTDVETVAATRGVVREVAATGNAVFLGRGSQMVLRDNPRALHVHIIAPLPQRIQTIARREGLSAEGARRFISRVEEERANYLRTHYQVDWANPQIYHAVLNTGLLSHALAAHAIALLTTALDESQPLVQTRSYAGQTFEQVAESLSIMREAARSSLERYRHRL